MKRIAIFTLIFVISCVGRTMFAQDVNYNYDRTADFGAYKTYQWAERATSATDPLLHGDIQRASDGQLGKKNLQRVERGADLVIEYRTGVEQEKRLEGWSSGPRWAAMGHATTSTIQVGTLVLNIYDAKTQKLIWRGAVSRTLDLKADPDKNYKALDKAVAKLLAKYPPKEKK